jgi:hypothetical protein
MWLRNQTGCALTFVQDQADGALSSAAVLRVGLGPTTPPLCRCAKCTADLILPVWSALYRQFKHCLCSTACLSPQRTHPTRCPGAWCVRRSGIKGDTEDSRVAVHTMHLGVHTNTWANIQTRGRTTKHLDAATQNKNPRASCMHYKGVAYSDPFERQHSWQT